MTKKYLALLIISMISCVSSAVFINGDKTVDYPNHSKERVLVQEIEDTLMEGDIIYLDGEDGEFLTIFTESDKKTKQTVILVHGMGSNANTPQVIYPLRTKLSKEFNTISIQMPVLKAGKISDDYRPILFPISHNRIDETVKYLRAEGFVPVIIIGHSIGAAMSASYLSKTLSPISKFVAVGMPECAKEFLPKIDLPILDLFGTEDISSVISGIIPKKNASAHNLDYAQQQVEADHNFLNEDRLLIKTVTEWIKENHE